MVFGMILSCMAASGIPAQDGEAPPGGENSLSLRRVVILSSGLAYHEHSGSLTGDAQLALPFRISALNDVLKTMIINDPASTQPSVVYQSAQTLLMTLRNLTLDLSDNPDMATMLDRLRGEEVEITPVMPASAVATAPMPATIIGRVIGVEHRTVFAPNAHETRPWLLLNTAGGIRPFDLREVSAINFTNPVVNNDITRALDIIAEARNPNIRSLLVSLPGAGTRDVTVSYVVPAPVWKVSYRLDLGATRPMLQGWAIVDNDSDADWNYVELSLVAGRPASFIQELYPPFYVWRPTVPLAIAGVAAPEAHDTGWATAPQLVSPQATAPARAGIAMDMEMEEAAWPMAAAPVPPAGANLASGVVETAQAGAAGDQFEFTIRRLVSLDRGMSAMLPLVEAEIEARRVLIFSGAIPAGVSFHPRLGAEVTNLSEMGLPAGPITVFDGGVYAGSALIEFWNENESRFISFGEDLSVTGAITNAQVLEVSSVNLSGGVMTINRSRTYNRTYTFNNTSGVSKELVVEHPITGGANLVSPQADESTASLYRFNVTLPGSGAFSMTVSEQVPVAQNISLLALNPQAFFSFTVNNEIPEDVRAALQRAMELRNAADAANADVRNLEVSRNSLIEDLNRTRLNLEATGTETAHGQTFLQRLVALDAEIEGIGSQIETARANAAALQREFTDYLTGLNF